MQNGQITGIKIIKMNKLDFGVDDPFEGEEKKYKTLEVNISQCLSTTVDIEVPEDFEDYDDSKALCDFVREQIVLPSELILEHSTDCWYIDDFCVTL
jgi:hypothetical protein